MIYPFVRMLQEKCRDLTEEQIHKTLDVYKRQELLKTIQEQTGSAIVQKKEERYSFVEITD